MSTVSYPPPHRYFAASNSSKGFQNYYATVFGESRVQRLYIIKGGPGTGKSHFMKTVARRAATLGYRVTEYACSSDPASLDGVRLEQPGRPAVGILDGTAPHACEPITPGVREELLNLGAFWDAGRLMAAGEIVRRLGDEKAAAYARAYAYLHAAGDLDAIADDLVAPAVYVDRLAALAGRLLRPAGRGSGFAPIPALRRAISMSGDVLLTTFEDQARELGGTLIRVEEHYGLAARLMAAVYVRTVEEGHPVLVSYDPIYPDKLDGLLYPDSGLCILIGTPPDGEGDDRAISLRRYLNARHLRPIRGEVRRAIHSRNAMVEAALYELKKASKAHFELEQIYAAAMDFSAKEAFTDQFCRELFSC